MSGDPHEPGLAPYADLLLWRRRALASMALNALLLAILFVIARNLNAAS